MYLCYFRFNHPSGPSLKPEAICFSIFKNTYQYICTRDRFFPKILPHPGGSGRGTCLGCYFQFHMKAECIGSKEGPELMFYQVTLQCVQSILRNRWKSIKQEAKRGCFVTFLSALGQGHNISYAVTVQRFIYLCPISGSDLYQIPQDKDKTSRYAPPQTTHSKTPHYYCQSAI